MNLKEEYNKAFVEDLANNLSAKASFFDKKSFIRSLINKEWENKELKERMRCITESIHIHLDKSYQNQLNILFDVAPIYGGIQGFIFSDFVQIYGINDPFDSFKALEHFTPFSTSEFAIRPFIEKYPEQTMKQMTNWSLHENHHLRRLASEGSRPRLPWAPPLRGFIKDPQPTLPILENLKNDASEYVKKSVANHLNDISKDHPQLILQIANDWHGYSKNTDWIIKHGLRTLLKKGNKHALAVFHLDNAANIEISGFKLSESKIKIGDYIFFEFNVINRSEQNRNIRLEYKIDYIKANGSSSSKVFQISEFCLNKNAMRSFKRKQWFKELSTRKHYEGEHTVTLIVNGDEKENASINLIK